MADEEWPGFYAASTMILATLTFISGIIIQRITETKASGR